MSRHSSQSSNFDSKCITAFIRINARPLVFIVSGLKHVWPNLRLSALKHTFFFSWSTKSTWSLSFKEDLQLFELRNYSKTNKIKFVNLLQ